MFRYPWYLERCVAQCATLIVLLLITPYGLSVSWAKPALFELAKSDGYVEEANFSWGNVDLDIKLSAQGVLKRKGAKGSAQVKQLKLPVKNTEYIERVSAVKVEGDILIAFDKSDGEIGNGGICRVRLDLFDIRWCQKIPAFNVYAAMGAEDSVFIGAIGFLARLNHINGKYIWRQAGLYQKDNTFNVFCNLKEGDRNVSFQATSGISREPNKQITLDKKTGKIIDISKLEFTNVCQ